MKQFWERILSILMSLRGRSIGVGVGAILGLLYLFVGFWKVIIVLGFVVLGYAVGTVWERNEDWRDVMDRILPPKS